ncbi:MAG: sulfate transporter CysZ [Planctomycetota bacterium]
MLADFLRGGSYFWRGLPLIFRPRIRTFAFAPLLITLVLGAVAIWATGAYFTDLVDATVTRLPGWLDWASWILWFVFAALWLGIGVFGFIIAANLVAAPFNGLLSEAVEWRLAGATSPPVPLALVLRRLPGVILSETGKLLYYALWAIPFLVASCLLNVVGPFLWLLFSAWMLAVEFGDYPMDNHGLDFKEMRRRLGRRRAASLGFGASVLLAFAIPGLNLLAMPAAVAGATLFWLEDLREIES